jgi:hypothetical protein
MSDVFDFFELDGALFRRDKSHGCNSVDDVLNIRTGEWERYTGKDKLKPAVFGSQVTEEEAMRLAKCTLLAIDRIADAK